MIPMKNVIIGTDGSERCDRMNNSEGGQYYILKLILEICKKRNLFVAKTIFEPKQIHLYANLWVPAVGQNIIDLFLVDLRI